MEFVSFDLPLPLEEIPRELRAPRGPESPFDKQHQMKQGYFFATPLALAEEIMSHYGLELSYDGKGATREIQVNGATDREAVTKIRTEQSKLRVRLLDGLAVARCEVCDKELPTIYLRVAHIKKRSRASEVERRDLRNVMLACTLGCDSAFENGDIFVNWEGFIQVNSLAAPSIKQPFKALGGKPLPAFDEASARYFFHHRRHRNSR